MRVPLDTAAAIGEVSRNTVLQWVSRGHINRYRDGDPEGEFETTEILLWLEQNRSTNRAVAGKLTAHRRYQQVWMAS